MSKLQEVLNRARSNEIQSAKDRSADPMVVQTPESKINISRLAEDVTSGRGNEQVLQRAESQINAISPQSFMNTLTEKIRTGAEEKLKPLRERRTELISRISGLPKGVVGSQEFRDIQREVIDIDQQLNQNFNNLANQIRAAGSQESERKIIALDAVKSLMKQQKDLEALKQKKQAEAFNRLIAKTQIALSVPEGTSIQFGDEVVKGLQPVVDEKPSFAQQLAAFDRGVVFDERGFARKPTFADQVDINSPGESLVGNYQSIYMGSTRADGTPVNLKGVDFVMPIGTNVQSNIDGEIVGIVSKCRPGDLSCNGGFGNQVKVKDKDGNIHTFNHLSQVVARNFAEKGSRNIKRGDFIGKSGNTGLVIGGGGESLSQDQINRGRGAHLDYTVFKPDGKEMYTVDEALRFAFQGKLDGLVEGEEKSRAEIDAETIMNPLSTLTIEGVPIDRRAEVEEELVKKREEAIKAGDVSNVLLASAGGKALNSTDIRPLQKGFLVLEQVEDLAKIIEGEDTGPIINILRSKNPLDVQAKLISAKLDSIIPGLAKGVYGEVGVLTDKDIETYKRTVPNMSSTEEVNAAILDMTLRTIKQGLDTQLINLAKSGKDVSSYFPDHQQISRSLMSGEAPSLDFTGKTREDAIKFLESHGQDITDDNIEYILSFQ